MQVSAKTDVGNLRENNQDYYYISNQDDPIQVFILADGMGGYAGGEVASKLATESALEYIKKNFDNSLDNIAKLITDSMQYANKQVYKESQKDKDLEEMGTTLEICLIYNNVAYIGHIGDSRIYRLRNKNLEKLTTDHSYVEKLLRDGTITKEEAFNHPKKNMLIKALGCIDEIEPDILVQDFIEKDILIICSDGLTNMVSENQLCDIVNNEENKTEVLVNTAKTLGGYDNITVIIIQND